MAVENTALSLFGSRAVHTSPLLSAVEKSAVEIEKPEPSKLWKLGKLNHVAIAVPDVDQAALMYRNVLGATVSHKHEEVGHGVSTVFVKLGNTKIELLEPLGDHSPIEAFLKRHGHGGLHHICIEVSNVYEAMEDLKSHNVHVLGTEPKPGAHGKPVIFLHPRDCNGTLVELEQA